ncbi:putative P-loop containing nucleoside triphosphate hydrolase, leucine-rich repeat domain superfamily [Helianthus debilis subsp. tardiflorus]
MDTSPRPERKLNQSVAAPISSSKSSLGSKKLVDEIFVGLDHDAELIRDKLVEDQKKLDVVSIVGMGGIGKTTLATKVYNDGYVKHHFYVRVWVTVSQIYDKRAVLTQILDSIRRQLNIEKASDSILGFVSVQLNLDKASDLRIHEAILESIRFQLDLEKASDLGLYQKILESISVQIDLRKAGDSIFRKAILESISEQLYLGKASDPELHEKIIESISVQLYSEKVSDSEFRKTILESIHVQLDLKKASDMGLHQTILESIRAQLDLLKVSDSEFRKTILESIRVQLDIEKASDSLLRGMVHKQLMGQRYLIVIDDIWHTGTWDELKLFFPHENTGSRILLTSRLTEVAKHAKSNGLIHHLGYLDKEKSWELLREMVFHGNECPKWLIKPGMQIVKNCQGLPLAVVVIAGVLAKETRSKEFWVEIAKKTGLYIVGDENRCMETLGLSYNHLPLHLRECFLYLGGFQEDYKFNVQRLTWLWVAEGFIKQDGNRSLEDIAEGYLMDLIDRNLVIVADRSEYDGAVIACKVHDLVRELCLRKANEEQFILLTERRVLSPQFSNVITQPHKSLRLFINNDNNILGIPYSPAQNCRSIVCFSYFKSLSDVIASGFRSFELLRVLNLQNCRLNAFPKGLELLVHLRYLAIRRSSSIFPSSICNLWSLQTLIDSTDVEYIYLPRNISNLVNLRHLVSGKDKVFIFPPIKKPMNLQTISDVRLGYGVDSYQKCFPYIKELTCTIYKDEFKSLTCLEKLKLNGYCGRRMKRITFPATLKTLTLLNCYLQWSVMSIIQSLPNLQVLNLEDKAIVGSCWNTDEHEFPQLKFLRFELLDIKEWEANSRSFPCLRRLDIINCSDLEEVPLEIGDIPTLELIQIKKCGHYVKESVRRIEEEQHNLGNFDLKIHIFEYNEKGNQSNRKS